jgi:transcriptional regulator with XRE-family HTH domain
MVGEKMIGYDTGTTEPLDWGEGPCVLDVKEVGRRLAGKRVERSLTQEELSKKADVSPSLIAGAEMGHREGITLKAFVKMCEALDVPVQWVLYGDAGQPHPPL